MVRLCLVRDAAQFPDCGHGAEGHKLSIAAADARPIRFADLPSGDYALAVIHDENANGRLDTMLGIPREGVGFSRNPPIRTGRPSFAQARFRLAGGEAAERVRIKYFL